MMKHAYLPAVRAECTQTKVGGGKRSVAARIRRCKSNPEQKESCGGFVGCGSS